MSLSFNKFLVKSATTKRQGDVSGGLSGDLETNLAELDCTPVDPVTPEVAQQYGLDRFASLHQTIIEDADVEEGDKFIVDSTEYDVRAVGEWFWDPGAASFLVLMLEEVK